MRNNLSAGVWAGSDRCQAARHSFSCWQPGQPQAETHLYLTSHFYSLSHASKMLILNTGCPCQAKCGDLTPSWRGELPAVQCEMALLRLLDVLFQAQEPPAALCGLQAVWDSLDVAGWQTEDPPSQLHSVPQLIWGAQQLLLDHKTVLLFIFIVVSIKEVRHQFGFTVNHGVWLLLVLCCREGYSAQLCLAEAELASLWSACPFPGTSGTLCPACCSPLPLSTLQSGREVAKAQNALL